MPVPHDDIVCRFIRPQDWSRRDNRPRPGAFKQAGLSVWHQGRLCERNIALTALCILHLTGYGQALHAAGDYLAIARESALDTGLPFQVQVEWRPEDEYVAEPWREWRYAHVQVEATEGPSNFLAEFRDRLAHSTRAAVPPEPQRQP